eukprot:Plantae.Rhodophyta-Rhodochaete_pulchella.ctg19688.p1 GENE.Plantae.Rhodophyta-Rhodochaete_pulchella.ctg19688~~Plantae.Rhodophyta-Rhodochaete_pulchella.ctg19688.p1  ORF type:complete len:389 (-),score=67.86 Plantae.Rhodophyta-Rhodochaete_pulchella.ctg19688:273-1418(-)
MGALHPAGSLYEKPINLRHISEQHGNFRRILESHGVECHDVRSVLAKDVDISVGARMALEDLAMQSLTYKYESGKGIVPEESAKELEYYVSDAYKRTVIEAMSKHQIVDVVLTTPSVTVTRSYRDTGFNASYSFEPLSNIIFTRDQQITTRKGIVMSRLRSVQRHKEISVMEFVIRKLGFRVIGRVPEPGYLEGGDFFPAGADLCLVGVGTRSTIEAVQYMMDKDLLGTSHVAVVKDEFEKSQDRMHLDTCFNILSPNCCVMMEEMMGEDSPTRRLVDEYMRSSEDEPYRKVRENVEFATYMRGQGYNIIPIPAKQQLQYACNFLNLGAGRILAVHQESARAIASSPYFDGVIECFDYSAITSMYGAAHCSSQVVLRDRTS